MADDVVVFTKADLPLMAYPLLEDIRRRGKLCDVTLKVKCSSVFIPTINSLSSSQFHRLRNDLLCVEWDATNSTPVSSIPFSNYKRSTISPLPKNPP